MSIIQNKKDINRLILIFTLTYMVSYITRTNYGAIILEIQDATGISKSLLSMALTGSFITYGVGQIISGICGDKFSPKKLVSLGLLTTVLMNLLIPICPNAYVMMAVWCVNGFAQAFMWPPMLKMMTILLSSDDYKNAMVKVSWGSSFGTITVYLISPLVIMTFSWKFVFWFSALCGIIMIILWNKFSYNVESEIKPIQKKEKANTSGHFFSPLILGIMIAIILQGMLRDGVTTWMPSYISETYNLSNIISILTGVVLPIFSILSFQAASNLYRKKFKNPLLCAGVIFATGAFSAFALLIFTGRTAVLSVLFSALLTGCMHGVNIILICMIPPFFKNQGNVSTVSGVLNSCTYVGSAISTYGIALLSDKFGWNFTLFIWLLITVLGTFSCLICVKPWNKKFQNNNF